MDRRQIQRFKMRLDVRQHELRLTIEHQLQYARRAEPEPDTMDQATSGYEKESLLQRSNQEQQVLRAVESALGRIRDGSFGQCVSCHNEIDRKRLEAVPWTQYCIQCQEDFER
jgi:DnaK suppressor protein